MTTVTQITKELKRAGISFDFRLSNKMIGDINVYVEYIDDDGDNFDKEQFMWVAWECFKAIEICYNNLKRLPFVHETLSVSIDDNTSYFIETLMHEVDSGMNYSIRYRVINFNNYKQ